MAITHRINDGGRSEHGYAEETNDCIVRAFSWALQKPYWAVHSYFKYKFKRVENRGLSSLDIIENMESGIINKMMFLKMLNHYRQTAPSLTEVLKDCTNGKYVILVVTADRQGHAIGIVDGVIQDTHKTHGRTKVCSVFRIK